MLYHSMKEDQNQKPVHVCAHKQQYIAVEAKKHLIIILVQDQAA